MQPAPPHIRRTDARTRHPSELSRSGHFVAFRRLLADWVLVRIPQFVKFSAHARKATGLGHACSNIVADSDSTAIVIGTKRATPARFNSLARASLRQVGIDAMGHRDLRDRGARRSALCEDSCLQLGTAVAPHALLFRRHRVHDLCAHGHDRCRLRPRVQDGMAANLPICSP